MPADFDTSEYALGVFQMFDTYKSEKITLIVENALMKYIIDQFGIDVHTERYDDDHFSAQVTVSASPNFSDGFSGGAAESLLDPLKVLFSSIGKWLSPL